MSAVVHHALLGLAIAALGGAALRVAGSLGGEGLSRAIAAAPIAVTASVVQALALGLVGLGTNPLALVVAACGTWLATRLLTPAEGRHAKRPAELTLRAGLTLGMVAGALAALVVWFLKYPAIGGDGLLYHLPEVVRWVQTGHPGSIVEISSEVPFGNYPQTNEVALAWGAGIARSFVYVTVWTAATYVLLLAAAWGGVRELGLNRGTAALSVAALGSSPQLLGQLNGPNTDLPALAWLVVCAALCARSRRQSALLVPAVLAAGLAVGTKTTTAPLTALCLVTALVLARGRLGPLARPLAAAAVAASVAGGVWYIRNLVTHGSPFWPFAAAPWGDPSPPLLDRLGGRLLTDPAAAKGRLDDYGRALGGDLVLIAGGLVAPLLLRRRQVIAAGAATAFACIAWASAPFTAYPPQHFYDTLATGATRYLLPAFAAGALALALVARERGAGARIALGMLSLAVAINLLRDASLGFPFLPSAAVLVTGAVVGGAIFATALARRTVPRVSPGAAAAALVAVAVLLSATASGYVERQARVAPYGTSAAAWLAAQPRFRSGDGPVVIRGRLHGTLAGDRIEHELVALERFRGCEAARAQALGGWLIINTGTPPVVPGFRDIRRRYVRITRRIEGCVARLRPVYADPTARIYTLPQPAEG